MADEDHDDDFDPAECWQCGGEGYIAHCFEDYACVDPEEGCDDCLRPCDICKPRKPDPQLQEVLRDALDPRHQGQEK